MNDRDPITEWEGAIKSRLGTAAMVVILLAIVCCLVAPVFGPLIKRKLRCSYALFDNCEELAEEDMKGIRVALWIVAALGWVFFIYCQSHYP